MECHSRPPVEQREPLAKKGDGHQRDFKIVRVDKRRKHIQGDMDIARSMSGLVRGLIAEHGCGDTINQPVGLRRSRAGGQEACRGPDPARVTILRREPVAPGAGAGRSEGRTVDRATGIGRELRCKSTEALGEQSTVVIKLPGGGRTEIQAKRANTPGRGVGGAPLKRREEWTPYTSHPALSQAIGTSRENQEGEAHQQSSMKGQDKRALAPMPQGGGRQWGPRGVDTVRWYSNLPLHADRGPMPFRRKKSVSMTGSVSWADDQYWACWDGWDEVIIWGDEGKKEERRGRQKGEEKRQKGEERGKKERRGNSGQMEGHGEKDQWRK